MSSSLDASSPAQLPPPLPFPCARCRRSFARPDHLARHVRTHTRETPYSCDKCGRAFARTDLLRRHDLRHHQPHVDSGASAGSLRVRVRRACSRCAASKLKCSDQRPCQPCAKKALPCTPSTAPAPSAVRTSPSPVVENHCQPARPSLSAPSPSPLRPLPTSTANEFASILRSTGDEDADADAIDNQYAFNNLLQTLFTGENQQLGFLPDSHERPLDFDPALFDFSFHDVLPDLGVPAALQSLGAPAGSDESDFPHPQSVISAECAKAFQASIWHWIPSSADTRLANEPDPGGIPSQISTAVLDAHQLDPDISTKRMGAAERDRILSVILDQCDKSSLVRIATSFPAPEILEQLLHTALHFQTIGSTVGYIHIPTFSVQSASNELLCALVSCGAHLSPAAPVQVLGATMLDLMFHAILQQWARNNATTRNLQLAQAYAFVQHLLLWAGSKRRMEFGEGIAQPLITIARRCGMLQQTHSPVDTPSPNDDASELETKWHSWIWKESTIRLAHQIFANDVQTSMTVFINPLLSCSEMTLSLPAEDGLWRASTANQWRTHWLALPSSTPAQSPPRSLSDLARRVFLEPHAACTLLEQKPSFSASTTALLLYGLWDPIWNCQKTASWLRADRFQFQPLPLPFSAQSELVSQVLERLGQLILSPASSPSVPDSQLQQPMQARGNGSRSAEDSLLYHYLNLNLSAPIKRFIQLAGKEGEAEAHQAFLLLQEWTQAREGRRSLWHATQVYRNARLLSSAQMRNSFVVALYHASLALWSFGVVMGLSQLPLSSHGPPFRHDADHGVRLDVDMSSRVEKFIACNVGSPTITKAQDGQGESISIATSPGASMNLAFHILDSSSRQQSHDKPLFTCMVTKLMRDLADAVQSVGLQ